MTEILKNILKKYYKLHEDWFCIIIMLKSYSKIDKKILISILWKNKISFESNSLNSSIQFVRIFLHFDFFEIGQKITNFKCFCNKITHYIKEVPELFSHYLHSYSFKKMLKTRFSKLQENSEKIHMYSKKSTNLFHIERKKWFPDYFMN